MNKYFLFLLVIVLLAVPVFFVSAATTGYAWANNAGWINFGCTFCNVQVTSSAITGYAWSQNYGYIHLNPPTSGITNTASGVLSGSAWGENAGWINFSGVNIDCSGKFAGSATGDVVGTVNFSCPNCNVQTDWTPTSGCGITPPPPGGGGGGNNLRYNTCNVQKQCVSVLGAGVDQCTTSNDCATHNICNSQKQCVSTSGVGFDQCQTDSDCAITHNECNGQKQCVATAGSGIDQCQTNTDCGAGKHNECNSQNQCVAVSGAGNDQCLTSSDCHIMHNECQNSQCISVAGVGVNQCDNNNDCQIPKHNECNSQKQCVPVNGAGADKCQTAGDCIGKPIPVPKGPIETITKAVQEQIPESAQIALEQTKKIIESPQGSAITKIISTVGLAIATVAAAGSFPFSDLVTIPLRLMSFLFSLFGLKKRASPWGVVYDSVTKRPLDPAYVVLKNLQGQEVSSAITDLDGRYGFLVEPGVYQMQANKTNYSFPSQKLAGRTKDELYTDLYFGENIEIKKSGEVIIKNIPLDPVKFDWNEFAKKSKNLMRFYSKWDIMLRKIYDYFFVVGFIVAIIAYIFAPHPYNTIIMILYLILLLLRVLGLKPKAYGYIIDKMTSNPLSYAIIRIVMPDTGMEITSKPADQYGRYYCLVPPGRYYVKIEKKNEDGIYSLSYTSPVIDASKKGIIKEGFKI